MANPWRGEVEIVLDGEAHAMRLTLGALAELETALEAGSLVEIAERFEAGRFRASDVIALLVAGLRGGGHVITRDALLAAEIEGGPVAASRAAARLLHLAFALPEET